MEIGEFLAILGIITSIMIAILGVFFDKKNNEKSTKHISALIALLIMVIAVSYLFLNYNNTDDETTTDEFETFESTSNTISNNWDNSENETDTLEESGTVAPDFYDTIPFGTTTELSTEPTTTSTTKPTTTTSTTNTTTTTFKHSTLHSIPNHYNNDGLLTNGAFGITKYNDLIKYDVEKKEYTFFEYENNNDLLKKVQIQFIDEDNIVIEGYSLFVMVPAADEEYNTHWAGIISDHSCYSSNDLYFENGLYKFQLEMPNGDEYESNYVHIENNGIYVVEVFSTIT